MTRNRIPAIASAGTRNLLIAKVLLMRLRTSSVPHRRSPILSFNSHGRHDPVASYRGSTLSSGPSRTEENTE